MAKNTLMFYFDLKLTNLPAGRQESLNKTTN